MKVFTASELEFMIRATSPYGAGKSPEGHLRDSFQYEDTENGVIAYTEINHMQYTEEKWTYNKRWDKTLQNPNEGWFQETTLLIAETIAYRVGGVVRVIK